MPRQGPAWQGTCPRSRTLRRPMAGGGGGRCGLWRGVSHPAGVTVGGGPLPLRHGLLNVAAGNETWAHHTILLAPLRRRHPPRRRPACPAPPRRRGAGVRPAPVPRPVVWTGRAGRHRAGAARRGARRHGPPGRSVRRYVPPPGSERPFPPARRRAVRPDRRPRRAVRRVRAAALPRRARSPCPRCRRAGRPPPCRTRGPAPPEAVAPRAGRQPEPGAARQLDEEDQRRPVEPAAGRRRCGALQQPAQQRTVLRGPFGGERGLLVEVG